MNYTRTFLRKSFFAEEIIPLDKKDFHHEINVLRKKEGDKFIVFDGKGSSGLAQVFKLDKKSFEIKILEVLPRRYLCKCFIYLNIYACEFLKRHSCLLSSF